MRATRAASGRSRIARSSVAQPGAAVSRREGAAVARPLLVAVGDAGTPGSALAYAAEEALREGRGIRLVHVVQASSRSDAETVLLTDRAAQQVAQGLVQEARARLRAATDDQVELEVLIRRGHVPDVLEALGHDADRIILEHRQQARLRRVFTGSVAARTAARSPVPVVSVPEHWSSWGSNGSHVTAGVQADPSDEEVIDEAFASAASLEATLTVLHAWSMPDAYLDAVADRRTLALWRRSVRDQLSEQLDPWLGAYPKLRVRVDVAHMRPADALVNASRRSDLLVLGRSGDVRRPHHLGGTARALIRESMCPVVVVPVVPESPRQDH